MAYKWKPSASQKAAYKAKMEEKESLKTYTTPYAIRVGCYVEYYSINLGYVIKGTVINESYGETGQHTFSIKSEYGTVLVKGRNLYPNIINHIQGEESKKI